ncbi:MAG: lipase family alpha/beta hydrolase [Candidatus Woesearchaeota archaeon]
MLSIPKLKPRIKKILFIIILVLVFISFSILILRTYLNIQLILGYDVIIDLDVNREHMTVANGDEAEFEFTTSVKTNPFCSARCSYSFKDMDSMRTIHSSDSKITLIEPLVNSFNLTTSHGTGAKMYRYDIECRSERTFFCRTKGHNTSRKLSIILNHELNEKQGRAKNLTQSYMRNFADDLSDAYSDILSFNSTLNMTMEFFPSDNVTGDVLNGLNASREFLDSSSSLWKNESYVRLSERIDMKGDDLYRPIRQSDIAIRSLNHSIEEFVDAIERLRAVRDNSYNLTDKIIWNSTLQGEAQVFLSELNETIRTFKRYGLLHEKKDNVTYMMQWQKNLTKLIEEEHRMNNGWLMANYSNISSELCGLLNCSELGVVQEFDANWSGDDACQRIELLHDAYGMLNETQSAEIESELPTECLRIDVGLAPIDVEPPELKRKAYDVKFDLEDNPRKCCATGSCTTCCDSRDCVETPVLFLHGHSMDREASPDFNMDTFNNIQEELESYGILDMGRISLYRYFDLPSNLWGQFGENLSLKISYYYDVYTDDDSSIIVPTKNDNLDTYAVRLDDIIDSVLRKSNAENVTVIAHSMGGLVIRRYMQIFGTGKVDRVLTSGTPHHGITDWVSTFCPLFGERLECRDMREGSLFLNKLNTEPLPDIPFHNVVATGCTLDGKDSDGVVLKESAMLEDAENIVIEGDCQGSELLHSTFVRDLHPGYVDAVKDFLEIKDGG